MYALDYLIGDDWSETADDETCVKCFSLLSRPDMPRALCFCPRLDVGCVSHEAPLPCNLFWSVEKPGSRAA